MSKIEDQHETFSTSDDLEFAEYRPVSRLAVTSLILGFASSLALIQPLLCIVPLAAIVTSVLATQGIARSEVKMTGRWMALTGMVLALFFGAWGPSRFFMYRHLISGQARVHADHWLDLIAKDHLYEAFELQQPHRHRQPPEADLRLHYGDVPDLTSDRDLTSEVEKHSDDRQVAMFQQFWTNSHHRRLAMYGAKGEYQCEKIADCYRQWDASMGMWMDWVVMNYRLTYEADGKQEVFRFSIKMCREKISRDDYSGNHWYMFAVEPLDE